MGKQVVTSFVNPPIPVRSFDWCAYYEGEEEAGSYGYGTTEEEAIQSLGGQDMEPEESE